MKDDLPESFKNLMNPPSDSETQSECEQKNPLGHLNQTLTEENLKTFEEWKRFDEAQDNFCELDGKTRLNG
jgi:hypothetical protein